MSSEFFLKVFFNSKNSKEQLKFSMVDLEHYINEEIDKVEDDQMIDNEVQIFQNALIFTELRAGEIMVPRIELSSIEIHDYISNLNSLFIETGFSKILVYEDTIDNIIGYVHAFDLLKKPKLIKSILMPVDFVPETMLIKDVFKLLTSKQRTVSIVVDNEGGTSGMLTIEDIIEELFGEIDDEFDTPFLEERKISQDTYLFSARHLVKEINSKYNLSLPESNSYNSLGGMIMNFNKKMPKNSDVVKISNYEITILKSSSNRINLISLSLS